MCCGLGNISDRFLFLFFSVSEPVRELDTVDNHLVMRTTALLATLFSVGFSPSLITPATLLASYLPAALAQDGSITGPTTSPDALHYVCPAPGSTCSPPDCMCASTSPPGGLSPADVPQFVVFTADDAIQQYTIDALNLVLQGRKNPNGCPVRMTYFNSIQYTNFSLVTEWFVAGNEIGDHTCVFVLSGLQVG